MPLLQKRQTCPCTRTLMIVETYIFFNNILLKNRKQRLTQTRLPTPNSDTPTTNRSCRSRQADSPRISDSFLEHTVAVGTMEEVDASELEMMFDDVDDGDIGSGMRGLEKKISSATLDVGMR